MAGEAEWKTRKIRIDAKLRSLPSPWEIVQYAEGMDTSSLTHHAVEELPTPPLNEQRRIVAKREKLLGKVDACRKRLEKIPAILKRFRQSILAAACSGRLTEEWRQANDDPSPTRKVKRKPPINASGEEGVVAPVNWHVYRMQEIFSVQTGATPYRKNNAYYENGIIPWVKTGEVQNCEIFCAEEHITPLALEETNVKIFPIGTLLIAMYGEGKTRGQVGRLRIEAATNQACAALVRSCIDEATNDYVYFFCLSQYDKIREESTGGNQPNLILTKIKIGRYPSPRSPSSRRLCGEWSPCSRSPIV